MSIDFTSLQFGLGQYSSSEAFIAQIYVKFIGSNVWSKLTHTFSQGLIMGI